MDSDVKRLQDAFDSGRLCHPSLREMNFVDLIRALAVLGGARAPAEDPAVDHLLEVIGPADHYILLLVDGLGTSLLEHLPGDTLLGRPPTCTLRAVFPSTTATALTTLATGEWPCRHGVPGWWTFLEEAGISAVSVRFQGRFTGNSLDTMGIRPQDFYPLPSFWPRIAKGSLSLLPSPIAHSPFSNYVSGGALQAGYGGIEDALSTARKTILESTAPGILFIYLPQIDALCHKMGPDHQKVLDLIHVLNGALQDFVASIAGRARILITADHGLSAVPQNRRFLLEKFDPLLRLLRTHPTGEPTVPLCHVRNGCEDAFRERFHERFGDVFLLLSPREAEDLGLYGPEPMSPLMKKRLGSFIGIALEPAAVFSWPPKENGYFNAGFHGGLTPQEMLIPLIVR